MEWVHDLLGEKEKKRTFKVLLVGDSVGKSSLVLRFCADEFFEETSMQFIPMTLGLDVKTKALVIDTPDGKEKCI
ncbi:hypothetical protein BV898_08731 [Hypsibius exemplaris]|uniref:Uncharacterized protein n=1 Tax=Hypsibius exemplaris TaxID=2072580 RepID=A0A1W0WPL7_HYPEX|nr:hypothetical protein BV898_08731 [Hypsibius exemplaris]